MLTNLLTRARVFLGAAGLSGVLVALDQLALPLWAQAIVIGVAALGVILWTRTPDADGDGIPDWIEEHAPLIAGAIVAVRGDREKSRALGRALESSLPASRAPRDSRGRLVSTLALLAVCASSAACGHAEVQRPGVRWAVDAPVTTSGECGERYGGDVGCEAEADARAKLEFEVGLDACFLVAKGLPDWCIPIDVASSLLVSPDEVEAGACIESPYLRRPVCRSYER